MNKAYKSIPEKMGECPVCVGTGRVPLTEEDIKYSWNKDKKDKECCNCGGQKMFGTPKGFVPINKNGDPCTHKYVSKVGRWKSTTMHACELCNDNYTTDSSG